MASLSNLNKLIKFIIDNDFFDTIETLRAKVREFVASNPVLVSRVVVMGFTLQARATKIGGERGLAISKYVTYNFPSDCQPATGTSTTEVGCVAPMITILEQTSVPIEPVQPNAPARTPWSIGGKQVEFYDGLVTQTVPEQCVSMKSVVGEMGFKYHSSSNITATAKALQFFTTAVSVSDGEYVVPSVASDKTGLPKLLRNESATKMYSLLAPVRIGLPSLPKSKMSAAQFFIWLDNNIHSYPVRVFDVEEGDAIVEYELSGANAFTASVLDVFSTVLNSKLRIKMKKGKLHFLYPKVALKMPESLNGYNLSGYNSPSNAMLLLAASRSQRGQDDNTKGETHESFYTGVHLSEKYVQDVLNYKNVFVPALRVVAKLWEQNNHKKIELQVVADKGKLAHILALGALCRVNDPTIGKLSGGAEFSIVVLHELTKSRTTISKACDQAAVLYRSVAELDNSQPVLYWFDRSVEFSHKNHGRDQFSTYVSAVNSTFAISTTKGTPFMIANLPAVDLFSGSYEPGATPHNMRAFFISDPELGSINTVDKLSAWCSVSAIINWDRTCTVYTNRNLYDSLESASKISEAAASMVRPLAGTLIPSYRKALDTMDLAIVGVIDAEGGTIDGNDDDDGELEVTMVQGVDSDDDDGEDKALAPNNTSPPKVKLRKTFTDDDA